MTQRRIIRAADLFCGAGGTTTGLLAAARGLGLRLDLVAVNHWPRAIETHIANYPWARHICAELMSIDPPDKSNGQKALFQCIDSIDPKEAMGGRKLDLLVASPECTDHSNAMGGRRTRMRRFVSTSVCFVPGNQLFRYVLVLNLPLR